MMQQNWWETTFPQGQQTLTILDGNGKRINLAYGEKGEGQPLILVHGIASWSYGWRGCIDPLAQHFRVICLDLKGNGFSDAPPEPDIVGHQVIELQRTIEALCEQPAIIVAQSLGALITLGMVQQAPQLCDRLVLINVSIFADKLPAWWMQGLAVLPLPWVKWVDDTRLLRPFSPVIQGLTAFFRREVVADPSEITAEDAFWISYPYIYRPGTLFKYAQTLQLSLQEIQNIPSSHPNLIRQIREKLPILHQPTLVLWGEQDKWFPVQHGEKLAQKLPHADFRTIPHCGHDAAGTRPQAVTQAVLDFLSK